MVLNSISFQSFHKRVFLLNNKQFAVGSSIEVLETVEVAVASNVVGFVVVSIAESELEVSCSSESVLRSGDSEVANSPSCS